MDFEWDENKNKLNIEKHGIDFNEAKEVFKDPNKKAALDLRKNYGEDRWIALGKAIDTLIVVVYTIRNQVFSIISARYAKKAERDKYYDINSNEKS